MIRQVGDTSNSSTGAGAGVPEKLGENLTPEWRAPYEYALTVARTAQERTFLSAMELEHVNLGRAPTIRELKNALAATSLGGLSTDRLSQIRSNLLRRLPQGSTPILFTRDRPVFRYLEAVRAEYEKFIDQHKQPPNFAELRGILAGYGIRITKTSLINILKRLRETAEPDGKGFSLSRHRISVTTSQIETAYSQAAECLRRAGITEAPTAALVARSLRHAGHPLSRETLEYRFASVPELKSFEISPHFDPGDQIIIGAHKHLRSVLGRDPTTKELTSEYNKVALRRAHPDSVWTRVSRLNKKLPAGKRMSFSDTFGSGIYDVDLKRVADSATKRLGRPPTLKELRTELLFSVKGSDISLDAIHRRSRRLEVPLTSEHDLTKEAQLLVGRKIQELRDLFGRRPFGAEVRTALEREGTSLSAREFNTTLASAKRYRDKKFQASVQLGLPGHLAGKLRQEYDELCHSMSSYPNAEQLAKRLGWKVAGVESALHIAQARAVRFRRTPVVLSNTPQSAALEAIRTIVRELGESIAGKAPSPSAISKDQVKGIKSMAKGWELPELPIGADTASLTVDQKLVRCEQWWALITCMQAPSLVMAEECEFEARHFEIRMARAFGVEKLDENPFEGFVQVLRVAKEAGRITAGDLALVLREVESSPSIAAAYTTLRSELMGIARQCGFSSSSSSSCTRAPAPQGNKNGNKSSPRGQ